MRKWTGLLLVVVLLAGCSAGQAGENVVQNEVESRPRAIDDAVVSEAVIEPAHWTALGFKASGTVKELLAQAGDVVEPGDVLVQLDPADAQLAVRQAEVALRSAEARLSQLTAGARPQQIAAAEAQLAAAQARRAQAAAQRDQVMTGLTQAERAAAEADVAYALAEKMRADDAHDQTVECFSFKNPYTGEAKEVCPGLGSREEQARMFLAAAEEALVAAGERLSDLNARPHSGDVRAAQAGVQAAEAEVKAAQARLDLMQAGPTDEEIAAAEGEIKRAQAALELAQTALGHTELRAPFAGTVTMVAVEVGNVVAPGQVAGILATTDQLQARTSDLSELDVAAIRTGQSVRVTVDALPEREFQGVVRKVALQAEDFRGETVFPVTVELMDAGDGLLRWGMTAWLEFGTP